MYKKSLLSDTIRTELARLSANHKRMIAAISYVTAHYLDFKRGDLLVCDASEQAIRAGMTSARTLRRFFRQGAELYSYTGLHSKVAVIDSLALVGSANLSENAGVNTCEASLLTDDKQVAGLIQGFIELVRRQAVPLTDPRLERLETLPVERASGPRRGSRRTISVGTARLWVAATVDLPERTSRLEARAERAGEAKALRRLTERSSEVYMLRWSGRSRFRSQAKPGDLVLEIHRAGEGRRVRYSVREPRPICYRQDNRNWTRFYLEGPKELSEYRWRDVKRDLGKLLKREPSPRSTRELVGDATNILELLQRDT